MSSFLNQLKEATATDSAGGKWLKLNKTGDSAVIAFTGKFAKGEKTFPPSKYSPEETVRTRYAFSILQKENLEVPQIFECSKTTGLAFADVLETSGDQCWFRLKRTSESGHNQYSLVPMDKITPEVLGRIAEASKSVDFDNYFE